MLPSHRKTRNSAAIVLGMTPELRIMAAEKFAQVVSVDQSNEAIGLYEDWLSAGDRRKENIFRVEWGALDAIPYTLSNFRAEHAVVCCCDFNYRRRNFRKSDRYYCASTASIHRTSWAGKAALLDGECAACIPHETANLAVAAASPGLGESQNVEAESSVPIAPFGGPCHRISGNCPDSPYNRMDCC